MDSVEDGLLGMVEAMMNPWVQLAIQKNLLDYAMFGGEAMRFAASCETKDYTILWEDMVADRAEFNRLVKEHQSSQSSPQAGLGGKDA